MSNMEPLRMIMDHNASEVRYSCGGWVKGLRRPIGVAYRVACRVRVCALVLAFTYVGLPNAHAVAQDESPEDKGYRIAREASARNDGFGDFTARMSMVLRDRKGRESVRKMRFKVLEVPDDGDKSLFLFDQPRDVQGTALLTHAHVNSEDDQWLYLPALKRVKRINASRRSGSFMGSEFTYEDMSPPEFEEYTYRFLREEPCGKLTCTVTEQIPLDEGSGYSRKVVWQDTAEFRTWKMELYDRKGSHLKSLSLVDYQLFLNRFWRAAEQTMVNHLTGASTTLQWSDFSFGNNLDDREFTRTALRRSR
ncbi:MAG: outer membrane lipoprotein-sorting protein [Paracoccaceae bacterium]|nr:outer membrane lipoprotein-sorting protein [Paracoccaceae bacterium]